MNRIEVILTEDDFVNAQCFAHSRLASAQKIIRKCQVLAAVLMLLILISGHFFLSGGRWLAPTNVAITGVLLLFGSILILRLPRGIRTDMRKNIRKMLRETISDRFGKPLTIELREEGVVMQNFRGQLFHRYSTIGEILEHEGVVCIFVDKASHFILPRDRIPRETLDAFLDELKKRMAAYATQSETAGLEPGAPRRDP